MGYVYLIHDENNDIYKIGVTRNNDGRRIHALQTGNGTRLNIIYNISCPYPFRLESMLHNHFNETHVLNEWYELTKDDVEDFPNLCEKYKKIIEDLKDNPFFNKKGLK